MTTYKPYTRSAWRGWAARQVRLAVADGTLTRPSRCEHCLRTPEPEKRRNAAPIEAHHHAGYNNPLVVAWMCRSCHRRAHRDHVDLHEHHLYWRELRANV